MFYQVTELVSWKILKQEDIYIYIYIYIYTHIYPGLAHTKYLIFSLVRVHRQISFLILRKFKQISSPPYIYFFPTVR